MAVVDAVLLLRTSANVLTVALRLSRLNCGSMPSSNRSCDDGASVRVPRPDDLGPVPGVELLDEPSDACLSIKYPTPSECNIPESWRLDVLALRASDLSSVIASLIGIGFGK